MARLRTIHGAFPVLAAAVVVAAVAAAVGLIPSSDVISGVSAAALVPSSRVVTSSLPSPGVFCHPRIARIVAVEIETSANGACLYL